MTKENSIDDLIYAKEILLEKRKELLKLYTDSYGKLNSKKISKKMDEAIYIFDSLPTETEFFLDNNPSSYNNSIEYEIIKEEAKDYKELKQRLLTESEEEKIKVLKVFFNINKTLTEEEYKSLLSLNFSSYSSESYQILLNPNIDNENKLDIRNERKNYLIESEKLGILPIVDPQEIDTKIQILDMLKDNFLFELISQSKFIQRKKQEIFNQTGIIMRDEEFIKMYEDDYALAVQIPHFNRKTGKMYQILHCPIFSIANYSLNSLDQIFLHENRHLIESKSRISDYNRIRKYSTFTELRTEKNSFNDYDQIDKIFYRTNEESIKSGYYDLFPLCGDLFEKHLNKFNRYFFNNNISSMERTLGKDIIEYSEMLNETLATITTLKSNNGEAESIVINPTPYLEKVEILKNKLKTKFIYNYYK